ncbi:MAG: hypothetical protein Q8L02_06795, partial [Candidatus Nitrotoga sp.]|nr:hypothetical protein [Candidatus Nitrotoga sp.]
AIFLAQPFHLTDQCFDCTRFTFELFTAVIQPNCALGLVRFPWVDGVRDVGQVFGDVKKVQ